MIYFLKGLINFKKAFKIYKMRDKKFFIVICKYLGAIHKVVEFLTGVDSCCISILLESHCGKGKNGCHFACSFYVESMWSTWRSPTRREVGTRAQFLMHLDAHTKSTW